MESIIKLIYNRCYRRNINVTKEEILTKLESDYSNKTELTEEEKESIVTYFVEKYNSSISTVKEEDFNLAARLKTDETPASLYQPVNSGITRQEATTIVFSQVEVLDLELKTSDIKSISQKLYEQNLAGTDAIKYAVDLIKEYIGKEEQRFTSALTESMQELVQHANSSYKNRNKVTVDAFKKVNADLEVSATAYKRDCEKFKKELADHFKSA